jgi:hypothetical protein
MNIKENVIFRTDSSGTAGTTPNGDEINPRIPARLSNYETSS